MSEKSAPKTLQPIRLIALFEASKGALVVIAGIGLLSLVHKDVQAIAERLVEHSHLNPASHYPRIFIEAATRVDDHKLKVFAALAFLYSSLRFIEAYGLWRLRAWAEWMAIISGSIYLPLEIYELFEKATAVRAALFLLNLLIVGYLIYERIKKARSAVANSV